MKKFPQRWRNNIIYESRIVILVSFHTISGVIPNSSFYDPLTTTWWKVEGVISWQHLLEIGNNASEGNLRARLANIAINQVVVMETRPSEMEVSPLILDNQSPSNTWDHQIPLDHYSPYFHWKWPWDHRIMENNVNLKKNTRPQTSDSNKTYLLHKLYDEKKEKLDAYLEPPTHFQMG